MIVTPERRNGLVAALSAHFAQLADPDAVVDLTEPAAFKLQLEPEEEELIEHLNAFLARIHRDLLAVCSISNDASRAAADNTFLLKRIAASSAEQSEQTAQIATAVHESARASEVIVDSSEATHRIMVEVDRVSRESATAMSRSLARLEELRSQAGRALHDVQIVVEHSEKIDLVTTVIDDISTRTNLLAINAAIEAAHAGDTGRGFSIVAAEIKRLADSTKQSARDIAALVKSVRQAIDSARIATQRNADNVAEVSRESALVSGDLAGMTKIVESSTDQSSAIASAVDEQSATLHIVSQSVEELSRSAQEAASHAAAAGRLQLGAINGDVFAVTARYKLGTFFDQMRQWSEEFAASVERVVESALARGRIRAEDLLELQYEEYTPATARELARLFNIDRLGPAGFATPKYRTRSYRAIDEDLMPICDECADRDPKIVYASLGDLNGFSVMSSRGLRQAITGDPQRDRVGNRIKQFFDDPLGLRAARLGLGEAALEVPKQAPRSVFLRAGIDLRQPQGARAWLLQTYARDTGRVYNDLAMPVYVRGERWCVVRVGYEPVV